VLGSIVALVTALVFALLSLLHVFWALGGRWAGAAVVPERDGKPTLSPGPLATLVAALLLFAAAGLVAAAGGIVTVRAIPGWLPAAGTWCVGVVMLARFVGDFRYVGVFKRVRGTRFARLDSRAYSPLCLALAAGCAFTATHA
jgi:hypothetical protein